MQHIYGIPMITLDDIIKNNNVGRPQAICDFLLDLLKKQDIWNIIDKDASFIFHSGFNVINSYQFIFTPIEIIEQAILYQHFQQCADEVKNKLISENKISTVEHLVNKFEQKYEEILNKYDSTSKILNSPCFMFVYDEKSYTVINVYTAIPGEIIYFLSKDIIYVCETCKKVTTASPLQLENFIPDLYYVIIDNSIKYFHPECIPDIYKNKAKHLGE